MPRYTDSFTSPSNVNLIAFPICPNPQSIHTIHDVVHVISLQLSGATLQFHYLCCKRDKSEIHVCRSIFRLPCCESICSEPHLSSILLCTILFSALTRSDEHLYHIEQNLDNAIPVTKSIAWQFWWYGHGECKLLVDGQWLYDAFNFSQQSMEVKSSQIQREATTFKPREVKDIVYQ